MLRPLFFVVLLWVASSLAAQPIPSLDTTAYQQARAGLILWQNDGQLLPLHGLDTLRPVLLAWGMPQQADPFWEALQHYVPTLRATWLPDSNRWDIPPGANLLVLATPTSQLRSFPRTPTGMPMVVVEFGQGFKALAPQPAPGQVWLQVSTGSDAWSQSLAAQALFGGIGLDPLPAANAPRHTLFPDAQPLALPAAQRLAYAPPAMWGFDANILHDSIAAIVQAGLDAGAYPGAQVLVAKNGVVVYHQAFGRHTYAPDAPPVTPHDIYDLASVTKITSSTLALMQLYGQGRLDLDAPLAAYLPEMAGSNKAPLTLRAMLSHRARLRAWIPFWRGTLRGHAAFPWQDGWDNTRLNDYRFRPHTLRRDSSARYPIRVTSTLWAHRDYPHKIYDIIRRSPLNDQPGYVYSDLSFILYPELVSRLVGQPFETYLQTQFYRPLGAHSFGYNPWKRFPLQRIVPTERDTFFRMTLLHGAVHDEGAALLGGVSGHAGLFASANDLAKLMQLYLNGGSYGGRQYLLPTALDTFTHRHYATEDNYRALGFDKPLLTYDANRSSVAEAASPASFGHSGYTGTFTWADPANGLLFIFLSNRVHPTRDNRLLYTLNIRPRLHAALYQALEAGPPSHAH